MPGSKTNELSRAQVLAAVRALPQGSGYVWDGVDEDDRQLNGEELQAGLVAALKKRGRPVGSGTKEQVAIRFDRDVLSAFRGSGPGWQTRMNDALRDWLRTHSAV
jgi:uncharacterized protein (DUF4415 family)